MNYGLPIYQPNGMINYQPYQNQYSAVPQQQQPTSTDERIWVQSEQAAEAYLVAPSSFVRLWDSNKPVFYEKRADATGKPYPMEVYEYSRKAVESSNSASLTSSSAIDYEKEINALNERIEALENILKGAKNNAKHESDANDASV